MSQDVQVLSLKELSNELRNVKIIIKNYKKGKKKASDKEKREKRKKKKEVDMLIFLVKKTVSYIFSNHFCKKGKEKQVRKRKGQKQRRRRRKE